MKVLFFLASPILLIVSTFPWTEKLAEEPFWLAGVKCTDVLEGERNVYDIPVADTFVRMANYKKWLHKLEKIQINLKAILERLYEVTEQGIQWSRWTLGMWQVASGDKSLLTLTSSHFSFKLGQRKVKKMQKSAWFQGTLLIFPSIQQMFASVMPQCGQQLCEISNADC